MSVHSWLNPYDFELSHDIFCISRSDTNRRADGGHPALRALMAHCLRLMFLGAEADVCEAFFVIFVYFVVNN